MTTEFDSIGLYPELVQTLVEKGYKSPTPIQAELIPVMLDGRDVIGQSQTGSGKTAAFGLPILQNLSGGQRHVQSLIMTPTRELALQVAGSMVQYGRSVNVRVLPIYGGQSYTTQIRQLKKGTDVVVGTPGRLLDLIRRNILDLSQISTIVLDEADEMLSMGFIEDIETILEATPQNRQTALFSATMPKPIVRLAQRHLNEPHTFTMGRKKLTVSTVEQRYYVVNSSDRLAALTRLFETEPIVSAMVFARTRLSTGELANELIGLGYTAEVLNGDLGQDARERVLKRFRTNQVKVLVATDVAARGLDIDHVSHVFNYDLPQDPEGYVHRIGRTGRAGKTGIAISLLTPKERWLLRKIEAYTKQQLTHTNLPTREDIQRKRDRQLVEQIGVWLNRGRCKRERELVEELYEQGHDVLEIAAAALKLTRSKRDKRPIMPISKISDDRPHRTQSAGKPLSRKRRETLITRDSHEEGMVCLALGSGKADGISVSHIVGSLSHHADIPGRCIGKIRIGHKTTFVDVPEDVVSRVLSKKSSYRIGRRRIHIKRA